MSNSESVSSPGEGDTSKSSQREKEVRSSAQKKKLKFHTVMAALEDPD
jgi:predicted Holliday junction resolvase-like endonuclease